MWKMMEYEEEYFQGMLDMTIEYYGDDNDIANDNFIRHEYFAKKSGQFVNIQTKTRRMGL